ncbi:hypothetical protein [Streptomyces avermitilis]|uniref:hypothetical protein n=1 Tax=Streptomyces avermitilis TaxID=33903 RepID=UPI0036B9F04C
MDPRTYAKLYSPCKPSPSASPRTGVTLLAALLWGITAMSLAWLTFLVGLTALWSAAEGTSASGLLAGYAGCVIGGAALLTALAFVPGVRRMTTAGRSLSLSSVACPVPLVLAVATWFSVG